MIRMIGAADEFWRVRMTRIDASGAPDFEWRDDILYREPPPSRFSEEERWNVEAVRLEDFDTVVLIRSLDDPDEAKAYLDRVREDLTEMTKSEFEDAYLTPRSIDPDPEAEPGLD